MKLFISGWAGFKEALGDIPEDWYFINPFLDFDEEGILDFLEDKRGEVIVGWSTGGHIVLKNLSFFNERFKKIVIVSGFKKFTDYVPGRILLRMIQKMQKEPIDVIREFLHKAGAMHRIPADIDSERLIKGLEFLIESDINNIKSPLKVKNLLLVHGKFDEILPIKAAFDLKNLFPQAKISLIEKSHWITFKEINKILLL